MLASRGLPVDMANFLNRLFRVGRFALNSAQTSRCGFRALLRANRSRLDDGVPATISRLGAATVKASRFPICTFLRAADVATTYVLQVFSANILHLRLGKSSQTESVGGAEEKNTAHRKYRRSHDSSPFRF